MGVGVTGKDGTNTLEAPPRRGERMGQTPWRHPRGGEGGSLSAHCAVWRTHWALSERAKRLSELSVGWVAGPSDRWPPQISGCGQGVWGGYATYHK